MLAILQHSQNSHDSRPILQQLRPCLECLEGPEPGTPDTAGTAGAGTAPHVVIRYDWPRFRVCLCSGENVEMMLCHPSTEITWHIGNIGHIGHIALCFWRPSVSCKPSLPAEKPSRFIFSKCIQNKQEWSVDDSATCLPKYPSVDDYFMISSCSICHGNIHQIFKKHLSRSCPISCIPALSCPSPDSICGFTFSANAPAAPAAPASPRLSNGVEPYEAIWKITSRYYRL